MGNKTTVEVTEQTLYNIDIYEDETTVVTVEVPQDILTVEVSQFTVALELYNSDNTADAQPVFAKSGSDFTLRSFEDDNKTITVGHSGQYNEKIQVKLPDTGIRVVDGFSISTDSDDTANIVLTGSTIDINGVGTISVQDFTASEADITLGTFGSLSGHSLIANIANIGDVTVNTLDANAIGTTDLVAVTGNVTTVNATDVNTANISTDYVQFNTGATITAPQVGQMYWNQDELTLQYRVNNEVTLQVGQENLIKIKNASGTTLENGQAVYVTGATGGNMTVALADSSDEFSSATTIAIVTQSINSNAVGFATSQGLVRGLNTSAYAEGSAIYLNSNGWWSTTKPLTPHHLVPLGWVVRSHQTEGSIFVHINNGQELEELHDVLITNITAGDIVQWNAAQGYWENSPGTTDSIAEGGNLYYTNDRVKTVLQTYTGNLMAGNVTVAHNTTTDTLNANSATIVNNSVTGQSLFYGDAQFGSTVSIYGKLTLNDGVNVASGNATIPTLTSTSANISSANITTGNISTVNAGILNVSNTATIPTGNITTVNATTVNATDISATGNITVDGDATVSSDVVIQGNLTVNGTTTTVNTETLEVADNNVVLNSNHTGTPTQNGGITINRGDAEDSVFQWNETSDKFEVKVGTADAVLRAGDLESSNLTATQATITTGNITTVNATDVNTTNLDADSGSIDTLNSINVTATTGNVTTINSTDVNTTNLVSSSVTSTTGNITDLSTANITATKVVTSSLNANTVAITGNFSSGNLSATNGLFQNVTGSQTVNGGSLTINNDASIGGDLNVTDKITASTLWVNTIDHTNSPGNFPINFNTDLTVYGNVISNLSTYTYTIHATDDPDDFYNKTKYGAVINPDGIVAQTFATDRTVNLATETGNVYIGSSTLDTSTPSLAVLGQNKANAADLNMKGFGDIVWNNTAIDPDTNVRLGVDSNGVFRIYSAEGIAFDGQVSGNIVPKMNNTYTLGTPTKVWRDVYIGPGSLYIDGQKVIGSDETGTINFTTDDGQTLDIYAGGNGPGGVINMQSAGGVTTLNDVTVNIGNSGGAGTTYVRNNLNAGTIENVDLIFTGNKIEQTGVSQNLEIANNQGFLHLNSDTVYVGSFADYTQINGSSITGNVTGTVSDISNHNLTDLGDVSAPFGLNGGEIIVNMPGMGWVATPITTDNLGEGSTNLYFTDQRAVDAIEAQTQLNFTNGITIDGNGNPTTINDMLILGNDTVVTPQTQLNFVVDGLGTPTNNLTVRQTEVSFLNDFTINNTIPGEFFVNTGSRGVSFYSPNGQQKFESGQNVQFRSDETQFRFADNTEWAYANATNNRLDLNIPLQVDTISSASGTLTIQNGVDLYGPLTVAGQPFTTSYLPEGSNLYFTDQRAIDAVEGTTSLELNRAFINEHGGTNMPQGGAWNNAAFKVYGDTFGAPAYFVRAINTTQYEPTFWGSNIYALQYDVDLTGVNLSGSSQIIAHQVMDRTGTPLNVFSYAAAIDNVGIVNGDIDEFTGRLDFVVQDKASGGGTSGPTVLSMTSSEAQFNVPVKIDTIVSPIGTLNINNGVNVNGPITIGGQSLTTDFIPEGSTNLYYTDQRADDRIAAASILDLNDVMQIQPLGDGQILGYSAAAGNKFVNFVPFIDNLADVDTTTTAPVQDDVLVWNAATNNWEPSGVIGDIEAALAAILGA